MTKHIQTHKHIRRNSNAEQVQKELKKQNVLLN